MAFKGAATAKNTSAKTGKRAPVKKKAKPKKKKVSRLSLAATKAAKKKKTVVAKPKKLATFKAPKKTKTRAKIERKIETKIERATLSALRKPFKAVAKSGGARAVAGKIAALGATGAASGLATLGVAGSAVAITAAFALGYGIGTAARGVWKYLSHDERRFRQAMAFRKARLDFAKQMGRAPNAAEVKEIGAAFLKAVESDRPVEESET